MTIKKKKKKGVSLALLSQLNLCVIALTAKAPEKYEIDFRRLAAVERIVKRNNKMSAVQIDVRELMSRAILNGNSHYYSYDYCRCHSQR